MIDPISTNKRTLPAPLSRVFEINNTSLECPTLSTGTDLLEPCLLAVLNSAYDLTLPSPFTSIYFSQKITHKACWGIS